MQKIISMIICIFLITGGSAEASERAIGPKGASSESPAAVMLSETALDPLFKPQAVLKEMPGDEACTDAEQEASLERFSTEDLELLARLVQAEAGGEPYLGKVAVAASVLNRVESKLYPDTIPGVIYQVYYGYQYCPVRNGTINRPASEDARKAVKEALEGKDPTGGALSFYNPAKSWNAWIRSRIVQARIGNHLFVR